MILEPCDAMPCFGWEKLVKSEQILFFNLATLQKDKWRFQFVKFNPILFLPHTQLDSVVDIMNNDCPI